LALLEAYTWPGNVRELEHVISRGALRARMQQKSGIYTILPEYCDIRNEMNGENSSGRTDLGLEAESGSAALSHRFSQETMNDATTAFQKILIKTRLDSCDQNWSRTAVSLGMDRGNLHRLAKRLGLK
jgi:anaerobic nitric oxide reductase transcription regulator